MRTAMPNEESVLTLMGSVAMDHKAFDRILPNIAVDKKLSLPPSSPFWDSFMPPNGWNCRCTAVQVRRGKYPNIDVAEALAWARGDRRR